MPTFPKVNSVVVPAFQVSKRKVPGKKKASLTPAPQAQTEYDPLRINDIKWRLMAVLKEKIPSKQMRVPTPLNLIPLQDLLELFLCNLGEDTPKLSKLTNAVRFLENLFESHPSEPTPALFLDLLEKLINNSVNLVTIYVTSGKDVFHIHGGACGGGAGKATRCKHTFCLSPNVPANPLTGNTREPCTKCAHTNV
eukprot:TRINITY_DN980_c0_g1_i1.p1 TRINITY_DN980_c0_g1~~TRINITY_DN980_c0_g1_i1.p1  ORF type:complete len:195 (+),score=30.02 TRINITY_DN980_c0_g1_i1:84-668(+)